MDLLYNDILTLGKIFGKRNDALSLVSGWQKRLSELPKPAAGTRPLKVFVYDSGEDKPFTSGKYAMPTAMIEAAGGKMQWRRWIPVGERRLGKAWPLLSRTSLFC